MSKFKVGDRVYYNGEGGDYCAPNEPFFGVVAPARGSCDVSVLADGDTEHDGYWSIRPEHLEHEDELPWCAPEEPTPIKELSDPFEDIFIIRFVPDMDESVFRCDRCDYKVWTATEAQAHSEGHYAERG